MVQDIRMGLEILYIYVYVSVCFLFLVLFSILFLIMLQTSQVVGEAEEVVVVAVDHEQMAMAFVVNVIFYDFLMQLMK